MRENTRIDWHARVEQALARVFASLDEPLAWQTLAGELHASPWHFHRCFRQLTGETVKQCLRRLRLERAAFQAARGDARITDIALEAGFETLEAFLKAFRRAHGISPGGVRKLGAWAGTIAAPSNLHYAPGAPRKHFFIADKGDAHMDVKITTLSPLKLVCYRNIGEYWNLPGTWQKLFELMASRGVAMPAPTGMTVFHDHFDEVPMPDKRSDAAVYVPQDIALGEGLFRYETPGGLYAVKPHFGSCEEIGTTWDKWREEWLPASGWQLDKTRPSLEWYQGHFDFAPPELHVTLLCDAVCRA